MGRGRWWHRLRWGDGDRQFGVIGHPRGLVDGERSTGCDTPQGQLVVGGAATLPTRSSYPPIGGQPGNASTSCRPNSRGWRTP